MNKMKYRGWFYVAAALLLLLMGSYEPPFVVIHGAVFLLGLPITIRERAT